MYDYMFVQLYVVLYSSKDDIFCLLSCDPAIEWMHCEDTVDPSATWRESWRALERGLKAFTTYTSSDM